MSNTPYSVWPPALFSPNAAIQQLLHTKSVLHRQQAAEMALAQRVDTGGHKRGQGKQEGNLHKIEEAKETRKCIETQSY